MAKKNDFKREEQTELQMLRTLARNLGIKVINPKIKKSNGRN